MFKKKYCILSVHLNKETMQGQHERKDTDNMLGMLLHLLELYSLYSLIAVNS